MAGTDCTPGAERTELGAPGRACAAAPWRCFGSHSGCGGARGRSWQTSAGMVLGHEAHSAATARHTGLPGTRRETGPEGVLLSVPLRGLQQALGVLVLFCPGQPAAALEPILTFLELTGTYVGFYVQTMGLQERLKVLTEPGEVPSIGMSPSYDP